MEKKGDVFLTSSLQGQINIIGKWEDTAKAQSLLRQIATNLKHYIEQLTGIKSGIKRAKLVHQEIDRANDRTLSEIKGAEDKITCKKSCSHCCHQIQVINDDEAKLLAKRAKEIGIDRQLLREQSEWKPSVDGQYEPEWFRLSPDKNKCVFLDDGGECRVYEDRPASCRIYFSVGDPMQCSMENAGEKVPTAFFLNSQIVASASFNLQKAGRSVGSACGYLPVMVTKYLGGKMINPDLKKAIE